MHIYIIYIYILQPPNPMICFSSLTFSWFHSVFGLFEPDSTCHQWEAPFWVDANLGSIPTLGHATLENSTISWHKAQHGLWPMFCTFKIYVLKVLFARSSNRFQTYQYNIAIFINLHHLDFVGFSMTDISTVASFCSSPHIPSSIQCFRNEKHCVPQGLLTSHPQPGNLAQKDCPESMRVKGVHQLGCLKVEVSTESFKGYVFHEGASTSLRLQLHSRQVLPVIKWSPQNPSWLSMPS